MPSCSPVRSELSIRQQPDGLMSSLWRLRPKSVTAGSYILARQGIMMILAFHAPCWRGRRAIRIYPIGPTPLCPCAGRADRCLQRLVRWAGHEHLPRFCRTSFRQSKFSRAVWGGFDHFFLRGATLSPPLFPLARERQLNQAPNCFQREGLPGYCLSQSSILRFDAVTGFWPVGGGGGRTFLYRRKKALGQPKTRHR